MPWSISTITRRASGLALLCIGALVVSMLIAACGSTHCSDSMETSGTVQTCDSNQPVNLAVGVDETAPRGDQQLEADYAQIANDAAQSTIDTGGTLLLESILRVGGQPQVFYASSVPTLAREPEDQRVGVENADSAGWVNALKRAVTTGPPRGEFGSGILDGLITLLQTPRVGNGPLIALAETDGNQQEDGFDLRKALAVNKAAAIQKLMSMIPSGYHKVRALLVIVGIGATGGELTDENPAISNDEVQAWTKVCHRLATGCMVTEEVG